MAELSTFGSAGALTMPVVARGLMIGAALMVGPFLTRGLVRRLLVQV
ncbi:MAG: hypothetical protein ABWY93_13910 [Mycobacterium sp.]